MPYAPYAMRSAENEKRLVRMYYFHPVIVHFTIALLSVAVISDFLYLITKKETFYQVASWMLVIGAMCAVGAVLTGNQAASRVEIPAEIEALVQTHRNSGQITMWSFLSLAALRFLFIKLRLFQKPLKWIYYLASAAALLFLFRTGLLGGEMVYIHGVGVNKSAPPVSKPSFE